MYFYLFQKILQKNIRLFFHIYDSCWWSSWSFLDGGLGCHNLLNLRWLLHLFVISRLLFSCDLLFLLLLSLSSFLLSFLLLSILLQMVAFSLPSIYLRSNIRILTFLLHQVSHVRLSRHLHLLFFRFIFKWLTFLEGCLWRPWRSQGYQARDTISEYWSCFSDGGWCSWSVSCLVDFLDVLLAFPMIWYAFGDIFYCTAF